MDISAPVNDAVQPRRLGWGKLAAYGALSLPLATIGLPLSIYLAPFYAGELGLPLALLGTAMLAARLIDLIVDPLIGLASDRWRPAIGRRKVWLPIGVALMLIGVLKLFMPAAGSGIGSFMLWITVTYIGFTATKLPYEAWGAELSHDYAERTRITSARQLFSIAGLVVATLLPAAILARHGATSADVLRGLGWLMCGLLPAAALLLFAGVRDPKAGGETVRVSFAQGFKLLAGNGPFKRIGLALFLGYIAETFRITITVFFARDVIGVSNIGIVYVWYFVAGLAGVPAWLWLGNRFGKHRAFALALSVIIVTNAAIFLLPHGATLAFTLLFVTKGACFGALELLPSSMIADTADVDTVLSRQRRQGLFFALIGIAVKLGQAIGQGLSLNLLAAIGYHANGANTAAAIEGLRLLYCFAPLLLLAAAVALAWNYPLTARRHARIRDFIAQRQQSAARGPA